MFVFYLVEVDVMKMLIVLSLGLVKTPVNVQKDMSEMVQCVLS